MKLKLKINGRGNTVVFRRALLLTALISAIFGFSGRVHAQAACAAGQVLINEIYTEGGLTGAAYQNDYVELYNTTGAACNLTSYSIQVASGNANNFPNVFAFPNGSIIPGGGFFLIGFGSGGANGAALPTADFSAATDLSTAGKVALVNNPASLTGNCASNLSNSIDFVGYGSTNCSLTAPAVSPTASQSIQRRTNGFMTSDNSFDFILVAANPRNTLSPTAAGVTIGGRVTSGGRSVSGATVYVTDYLDTRIVARTNAFGYYTLRDVPAGRTYFVSVSAKGLSFETRVYDVMDNVIDLDFEPIRFMATKPRL